MTMIQPKTPGEMNQEILAQTGQFGGVLPNPAADPRKINYPLIASYRQKDMRLEALDAEIRRVGYVSLTDAISYHGYGGEMVFTWLAEDHARMVTTGKHRMWKIRVLRDEWGTPPEVGGTVIRRIERRPLDRAGRKLRSSAKQDLKRRGIWEREYVEKRVYEIDERGCITAPFEDAAWFLMEYGIHYETGYALCGRRELSSGPCKAPDGSERHVWYWRYEEAPPWVYEQLPLLGAAEEPETQTETAVEAPQAKTRGAKQQKEK